MAGRGAHPTTCATAGALRVAALPVALGAGLIVLEPDIGTASVVIAVALATLAVAGARLRLVLRAAVLGATALGAYIAVKPYAARRLFGFLHPTSNPQGSGYQLLQSKIGLGAGGFTGLGLGHSREKWGLLPNPHTDFIFTIVGEELGLIGTLLRSVPLRLVPLRRGAHRPARARPGRAGRWPRGSRRGSAWRPSSTSRRWWGAGR